MFCYQCEETVGNKGCTNVGVCGKQSATSDLQDDLIYLCKRIAKEGKNNGEENKFIIDSFFATITNANFDDEYFKKKIEEGKTFVNVSDEDIKKNSGVLKEENEDIRSLKETIIYGIKGMSAYLHHAHVLGYKDDDIYDFIRDALRATLEEKSSDELTSLVLKTGEYGIKTMALLDRANTESYGKPEPTEVNIGVGKNPGILISGHDLKDMKELLEQTKDSGVDIYTHSEMLPANAYPELKKYKHFHGNYGGSWWKQKEEFEKFNGPILMTTNCLVPPAESYRERVYVTGVVGFPSLKRIQEKEGKNDFSELIEHAKNSKPPEEIETGSIMTGFAHDSVLALADKIVSALQAKKISRFVVMSGCDGRHKDRDYYTEFAKALPKDTIILTSGCAKYRYNKLNLGDIEGIPRVLDAGQCNDSYSWIVVAQELSKALDKDINELPIAFNVAWYEQKAALILLSLLYLGIKDIYIGPKLPAFISPNVLKVLQDKFDLRPNSGVEADLKAMVG